MWKFYLLFHLLTAIVFALFRRLYNRKMKHHRTMQWHLSTKPLIAYAMILVLILFGIALAFSRKGELDASEKEFAVFNLAGWFAGATLLYLEKKFR